MAVRLNLMQPPQQQVADPVEQFGRIQQARNLLQQGQLGEQEFQIGEQKLAQGRVASEKAQRIERDQQGLQQSYMEAMGNPGKTVELATSRGIHPDVIYGFEQHIASLAEKRAKTEADQLPVQKFKLDRAQGMLAQLANTPPDQVQQAWPMIYQQAVKEFPEMAGVMSPMQPPTPQQMLALQSHVNTLESVYKAADEARKVSGEARAAALAVPTLTTAQNNAVTSTPVDAGGGLMVPASQFLADKRAKTDDDRQAARDANLDRHYRAMEAKPSVSVTQAPALTPETINMLAETVRNGGTLPPMGRNAGAAIASVLNKAAEGGNAPNLSLARADLKANQTALNAMAKSQAQIDSFEKTASRNIDIFLDKAKDVVDSGLPILNGPLRAAAGALGSDKVAAFETARETALTEAAKVLESPGGNAALTVSGRAAVATLSNKSATLGQQIAAMRVLKNDMANRKQSMYEEIARLRGSIGGIAQSAPGGGGQSGADKPVRKWNPSTGKLE
jgi:hypothetical protein